MTCARREAGARRPAPSTPADTPRRPEPRRGRFGARLFPFPTFALLLGALSLFHAAPAAAQNPTVSFQLSTLLVVETDTTPEDIVVVLSSTQVQAVTVGISVVAASTDATVADYTLSATSVTFEAGSTSATFTILATADMTTEGNEVVTLRLTPPAGIGLGTDPEIEIVISDDSQDPPTLTATPGYESLSLTWTAPGVIVLDGWDVHYTSAPKTGTGAVTDTAAATGTDAAAAWVAVTRTGTAKSQTISSLSGGTTYRLRVRWFGLDEMNMRTGSGDWFFGSGAPRTRTVSLSVFPTTVAEGGLVSVIATLSATPAAAVTIPITVTLDSAEAGDFSAGTLAGLRAGFAFPAGQKQKVFNLGTTQDTDAQDEKLTVALGTLPTGYAAGAVTSVTVTIEDDETKPTVSSPRTIPSPPEEGEAFTVGVTLSALPAVAVNLPLTVTLGTAEPEDFDVGELAFLRSDGIALSTTGSLNQSSSPVTVETDLDREDETFTVAIDTDALAELGLAMAPGAATSVEVTIEDLPWLELKIDDGDRKLLIGPLGELGVHTDPRARWVEVSPTTKSVTLTVDWLTRAIGGPPTAQVRYVMHGIDGDTLTWDPNGEKNTSKTLELYSPLGSPGYPRLTLSAGNGIDYTIYFRNNSRWEFHQDTLLKILEMKTQ